MNDATKAHGAPEGVPRMTSIEEAAILMAQNHWETASAELASAEASMRTARATYVSARKWANRTAARSAKDDMAEATAAAAKASHAEVWAWVELRRLLEESI